MDRNTYETLEYLFAKQAHESWSGWMRHLFSKSVPLESGAVVIPPDSVCRWERQMKTDFDDLPDDEQKSDVKEAQEYLELLRGILDE